MDVTGAAQHAAWLEGTLPPAERLAGHHERRLAELLAAVGEHPGEAPWQLAARLTWSRPWERYEPRLRVFGASEAEAHLRLLARLGPVAGEGDGVRRWRATPS